MIVECKRNKGSIKYEFYAEIVQVATLLLFFLAAYLLTSDMYFINYGHGSVDDKTHNCGATLVLP